MKKLLVALILGVILTATLATPAFAGGPPDEKPMPEKGKQGLLVACFVHTFNYASMLKINPGLLFPHSSVKTWTNGWLLEFGPPIAWGYWCNKP